MDRPTVAVDASPTLNAEDGQAAKETAGRESSVPLNFELF
jgi:hypothetical protein